MGNSKKYEPNLRFAAKRIKDRSIVSSIKTKFDN